MLLWLPMSVGRLAPNLYYGPFGWHGHEMLFGYMGAVIAGFLLTAVRNWTGIPTPTGLPLAALALLWLGGRIVPLLGPRVPDPLLALVDGAFLPTLLLILAGPLWRDTNKANRVFLLLLSGMALANLLVHLQALGFAASARQGQGLMRDLLVLLVTLVGGRVVPFFTEKAVPGSCPRHRPWLEHSSFALLIALLVVNLFYPDPAAQSVLASLAAVTQALRLMGWHDRRVWRIPILWVLYSGFVWVVLGLALQALGTLGLFPPNLALHALTVGGFSVLTLGMMARISLGHTGRELHPHSAMTIAFLLLNLAAIVRVFGLLVWASNPIGVMHLAGGLWIFAFLLFLVLYTPILLRPRVDGRPD